MRILFVTPEIPSIGGAGIATYIRESTDALTHAGHECHVLSWGPPPLDNSNAYPGNYRLHFQTTPTPSSHLAWLNSDLLRSYDISDRILQLHAEFNFDIIEGTDWCAPLYCLLQRRSLEPTLNNTTITIFNHGLTYFVEKHERRFIPRTQYETISLEAQCLRLADYVICPSEYARSQLLRYGLCDTLKIVLVPEPLSAKSPVRGEHVVIPENLLLYGSISVSKGAFEWIDIANILLNSNEIKKIEMLGFIYPGHHTREKFIRILASRIKFPEDKIAIWGPVPRGDALSFISEQHILLNMSPRETYCYAFVEGILSGALPLPRRNSAQEEFLPERIRSQFSIDLNSATPKTVSAVRQAFTANRNEIDDHVAKRISPQRYAHSYEQHFSPTRTRVRASATLGDAKDITVLIPAHNPDVHLEETIASVKAQSLPNVGIIIGNDGTNSDDSLVVLRRIGNIPGVQVIDMEWKGLAATRNRLLDVCKTSSFAFMDADDLMEATFIEDSVAILKREFDQGVRSVQGWYELFGEASGWRAPVIFDHYSHFVWNDLKNNIVGDTETFRRIRYNETLRRGEAEDWNFWLRYFLEGWKVRVAPKVLWRYRRHPAAMSFHWGQEMAVGTARANSEVLREYLAGNPTDDVFEFLGDYLYVGERFFDGIPRSVTVLDKSHVSTNRSVEKIQRRIAEYTPQKGGPTMRERALLRTIRWLSRQLT